MPIGESGSRPYHGDMKAGQTSLAVALVVTKAHST